MVGKIRPAVFWPPFLLLIVCVIASLVYPVQFPGAIEVANQFVLTNFGWLFSITTFLMVITCILVFASPLGQVRIGGPDAKAILTDWQWFSITLCTTIAVGVLFWGPAEPLFHYLYPPESKKLDSESIQSARFAMSTVYLHWTFTPYAIYAVPSLTFALVYYNLKKPFSLSSILSPLFNDKLLKKLAPFLDSIALFVLVAGMSASLGTGLLTITGGLKHSYDFGWTDILLFAVALAIVIAFTISAATGLLKGIRILSDFNLRILLLLGLFLFVFGPTLFILEFGIETFGLYLRNFPEKSLFVGSGGDSWPEEWSMFHWANWLAWAPVTALFLGRLGVGHTVRKYIVMNFFLPAIFVVLWMAVFSGSALFMQIYDSVPLVSALEMKGPESIIYSMFEQLPFPSIVSAVFLITAFLSYVTSADSNTTAMAGISSWGVSPESPEAPKITKIVWGTTIGAAAYLMVSLTGVDGIKALSVLGGFPAMILILLVTVGLLRLSTFPEQFDFESEDSSKDKNSDSIIKPETF